jgi:hypothetical protein
MVIGSGRLRRLALGSDPGRSLLVLLVLPAIVSSLSVREGRAARTNAAMPQRCAFCYKCMLPSRRTPPSTGRYPTSHANVIRWRSHANSGTLRLLVMTKGRAPAANITTSPGVARPRHTLATTAASSHQRATPLHRLVATSPPPPRAAATRLRVDHCGMLARTTATPPLVPFRGGCAHCQRNALEGCSVDDRLRALRADVGGSGQPLVDTLGMEEVAARQPAHALTCGATEATRRTRAHSDAHRGRQRRRAAQPRQRDVHAQPEPRHRADLRERE